MSRTMLRAHTVSLSMTQMTAVTGKGRYCVFHWIQQVIDQDPQIWINKLIFYPVQYIFHTIRYKRHTSLVNILRFHLLAVIIYSFIKLDTSFSSCCAKFFIKIRLVLQHLQNVNTTRITFPFFFLCGFVNLWLLQDVEGIAPDCSPSLMLILSTNPVYTLVRLFHNSFLMQTYTKLNWLGISHHRCSWHLWKVLSWQNFSRIEGFSR